MGGRIITDFKGACYLTARVVFVCTRSVEGMSPVSSTAAGEPPLIELRAASRSGPSTDRHVRARAAIACAGLWADRRARVAGGMHGFLLRGSVYCTVL